MSCLSFFAVLLPLGAALAQQASFNEIQRHGMDAKQIVLSSRGGASYEKNESLHIQPDQQPFNPNEEVKEFMQAVNGSTPTGWVHLGTPPKEMLAIFDTGSDKLVAKTWETLAAEMASFDPSSEGLVRPTEWVYDHDTSQTYAHKFVWKNKTREWVPEREMISYGSGVAETLDGSDTLHVGGHAIQNMSLSEITADSLQLLHTRAGISAVMGLQHMKDQSLGASVFSIARNRSMFSSFGYCVDPRGRQAGMDSDDELTGDNGTFIWGDQSDEGTKLDVVGDMHWAVHLGPMRVLGGKPRNETHGHDNKGDAVKAKFKGVTFEKKIVKTSFAQDEPRGARQAGAEPHQRGIFGRDSERHQETMGEDSQAVTEEEAKCGNSTHPMTCCGILDTGSNIIAGPTKLMKAVADQLDVDPFCKNYHKLPQIELNFGGMIVNISKEGYVMKVPVPKWAGNGDDAGGDMQTLDHGSSAGDEDDQTAYGGGMASKRWSLNQVASSSRQTLKRSWKLVFERLHKERGIDFRPVLGGFLEKLEADNSTDAPKTMCMPALVPLDMHTKYGPLFVVGTPLLATHYARWSFPKDSPHPTIHLKKLEDCERCKHVAPTHDTPALQEQATRSFIRSESQAKTSSTTQSVVKSSGPFIRHIDDIRFPHWARHITDI